MDMMIEYMDGWTDGMDGWTDGMDGWNGWLTVEECVYMLVIVCCSLCLAGNLLQAEKSRTFLRSIHNRDGR